MVIIQVRTTGKHRKMKIYSEEAQKIIYGELSKADGKFTTIHEYRNLTDFCIIPLIRRLHKNGLLDDLRKE